MTTTVLAYIPSPSQGVWHLGFLPIRAYALFIIAGIIVALLIGDRRWVARGGEPGVIYDIVLWAVPFGLVGGRLYHVITDWQKYFGEGNLGFAGALRIWDGGLGIWGAVALGGVGAWIGCRRKGIPLPAFGDAIAPGIILAQAIGRIGNYFNQELYGRDTTLPWGLEIYERRNVNGALDNLNGVSTGVLERVVHPTFLYELVWNLLVFGALILIDRRFRIGHGRLFAMYVAGYCMGRFWIELMRSDEAQLLAGIRINSFTSTFVFIAAVVYIMVAPKGREDPASLKGEQPAAGHDESPIEEAVKGLTVASGAGVVAAAKAAEADEQAEEAQADGDQVAAADAAETDVHVWSATIEPQSDAEPAEVIAGDPEAAWGAFGIRPVVAAPEAGVGAVEGDEVAAAAEESSEAHRVAVEAEADAATLTTPVERKAGPAPSDAEPADVIAGDPEAAWGAFELTAVPVEPAEGAEPEAGLGAVDGGEVAAAAGDAGEVHEAAVEGEAEAGELAEEVDAESAEAEPAESDEPAESAEPAEPEAGLGAVDGGEVAAAAGDAGEVHEAAVEGEAEAGELAEEVDAESAESTEVEPAESDEPAESAEPEAGLGAVDGGEVAAAAGEAAEVHEVAVEGEAEAGEFAGEVDAEAEAADADEVGEPAADEPAEPAESAEPEAGLGAVDGGEVAAAAGEAGEVHEVAVEGEAEAGELAEDVDAESAESTEVEPAESDEPAESAEPEAGLGAVEGGEVAAAAGEAAEVHEAAVEGEAEDGELAGEAEDAADQDPKSDAAPDEVPREPRAKATPQIISPQTYSEPGGRLRRLLRRRRNR